MRPIERGWDKEMKTELESTRIEAMKKISENSLIKMLTLEVRDAGMLF
jgi:hypothetical protein